MSEETTTVAEPDDKTANLSETVTETELPAGTDTAEKTAETVESDEQKAERERTESERAAERADRRQKALDRRFAELTAEKYAEKARADALAQQIQQLGQTRTTPAVDGEPKREQFEDYEAFLEARATFRAEAKAREVLEKFTQQQKTEQERNASSEKERAELNAYLSRQREIAKSIPDYAQVMKDADVELPNSAFSLIKRMADGPLIAYHLAKKPELADQFFENPPELHGVLLGQLSSTLKATAKPVSNAPTPGKTVAAKPGSSSDPPQTTEEYFKWAQKNMR